LILEVFNHQKWEKIKILQIFISLIMWTKMSNLISLDYNYGTLQLPTFGHGFSVGLWMQYDYMIRSPPPKIYFDEWGQPVATPLQPPVAPHRPPAAAALACFFKEQEAGGS